MGPIMINTSLTLLLLLSTAAFSQTPTTPSFEANLNIAWADRNHDSCAPYRAQYSAVLAGRTAPNNTLVLASGARISGDFNEQTGLDRAAVLKLLGAPSSVAAAPNGETKLSYQYVACLGEVSLDPQGNVVTAVLTPIEPVRRRTNHVQSAGPTVADEPDIPPTEQTLRKPSPVPVSRFGESDDRKPGASRTKQILRWTLLTVGVSALGYYGYKARGSSSGSGNCNNPNDIAADGSRCGGRAASERPGGRP